MLLRTRRADGAQGPGRWCRPGFSFWGAPTPQEARRVVVLPEGEATFTMRPRPLEPCPSPQGPSASNGVETLGHICLAWLGIKADHRWGGTALDAGSQDAAARPVWCPGLTVRNMQRGGRDARRAGAWLPLLAPPLASSVTLSEPCFFIVIGPEPLKCRVPEGPWEDCRSVLQGLWASEVPCNLPLPLPSQRGSPGTASSGYWVVTKDSSGSPAFQGDGSSLPSWASAAAGPDLLGVIGECRALANEQNWVWIRYQEGVSSHWSDID